jgi:DNA-binding Lrp family transcriptional regulator
MRYRLGGGERDPVASETPTQGQARPVARPGWEILGGEGTVDAFILVQVEPGKAASVFERIRSLEGVIVAQMVTGPYDVIARVRAADLHSLKVPLSDRLRALDGVLHALACPVVPRQGGVGR